MLNQNLPYKIYHGLDLIHISDDQITHNDTTIKFKEITGIRYGVRKINIYFIPINSYRIWITDSVHTIEIELATGVYSNMEHVCESRFEEIVGLIFDLIQVPLISNYCLQLLDGNPVQVASLVIDKNGIHAPFGRKLLSFEEYGGYRFDNGKIRILKRKKYWPWISISLRNTWNAVNLGPLLNWIEEKYLPSKDISMVAE